MAGKAFTIELRGEVQAIEALTAVSNDAFFAQKTALRAAARKGRSIVAKERAARFAVPMKLFKKRVRFFIARLRQRPGKLSEAKLWAGLERGLILNEHPKVEAALRRRFPTGFLATMKSSHRGWFHRTRATRRVGKGARQRPKDRGALPIKEHEVDVGEGAEASMLSAAREVMAKVYPNVLKRDYKRRIRNSIRKAAKKTARRLVR
jgi:hypothetical protein